MKFIKKPCQHRQHDFFSINKRVKHVSLQPSGSTFLTRHINAIITKAAAPT